MSDAPTTTPRPSPTRRALTAILVFQLGLAGLLVFGDVGRDFALPSPGPAAPAFDQPARPGDQTRRFDPGDFPATRPAPGGPDTRPSGPMPDRLTLEATAESLILTGTIAPGDGPRLKTLIADRLATWPGSPPEIIVNSPGGSVGDALTLGRALRDTGLSTAMRDTDICLSACPYIFAAGVERRAAEGARIGVHQHYFGENTLLPAFTAVSDIQRGQGAVMEYLHEMGVDPMLMAHGLATPPDEIYLLLPEELTRYNLVTEGAGELSRPRDTVARFLGAIAEGEREMAEALLAEEFTFTSPRDNALDRDEWFRVCWPHTDSFADFDILLMAAEGPRVFVTYETVLRGGARVRNAEVFTVTAGRIEAVEVFFGWSLPHPAPEGGSLPDPDG